MKRARKYYRKCGVCGARYEQSDMYRDEGSMSGWLCPQCFVAKHIEYFLEDEI